MSNLVVGGLLLWLALAQDTIQRPELSSPVAIRNVTAIVAPGETREGVTIIVENGRITAVAANATIPAGARELDGAGLYAYAGFIDGFTRTGVSEARITAAEERRVEDDFESVSEGPRVRSESANRNGIFARRRVEELLDIELSTFAAARNAGFTTALIAPPQAVIGGHVAVLSIGDRPLRRSVLRGDLAQTASFSPPPARSLAARDRYPSTAFGVMAHFRQTLLDAQWFGALGEYAKSNALARVELPYDRDLEALQPLVRGSIPILWEADGSDEIHRALDLAAEFKLKIAIVGGRDAFRVAERLKKLDVPVILTTALPKKPDEYKFDREAWRKEGIDQFKPGGSEVLPANWQRRPFQPAAAYEAAKKAREDELRNAVELEKAGVRWCISSLGQNRPADALATLREMIEAGLPADAAVRALTVTPAELGQVSADLGKLETGKRGSIAVFTKPLADKDAQLRYLLVDGELFEPDPAAERGRRGGGGFAGRRPRDGGGGDRASRRDSRSADESEADKSAAESKPATSSSAPASQPWAPRELLLAAEPTWPVETPADREPGLKTGGSALLTNALIITVSGDDLPNSSILIEGGKIKAIGRDLTAPAGVQTIDLAGRVVMPGIIDPHSHIALDSVNEFSLSVVPEVRCADVVDSDDVQIFRALAGGVTSIHAMHGSANTIGGQCVSLKLKFGRPAAEMIIADAPRTVKFATGENVKRSGMPSPGRPGAPGAPERVRRFPGSRMGVEAVMRRSLEAGRQYDEARRRTGGPPLRRDLRQEALADIYSGDIWINCHCYRADEILRLLSVAEDFGVRVATLHHCLEAYRIMPEIARHGAGTATFADWWAYKVEAYDAVPHNAGMLLRYGINSTLKSDSADLIRHMPVEAAKAMRFSGVDAREALAMITLNCAKLFGLDKRLGSIDIGKDADLAIFEGHPLDTFSRCVMTLVDGEVYFKHRDFDPAKSTLPPGPAQQFDIAAVAKAASARNDGAGRPHPAKSAADAPAGTNGHAAPPAATYAIRGATIHPVSSAPIENGTIVVSGGKISAVGASAPIPPDAIVIDGAGLHVWPGIINATSTIGLHEIDAVDVSVDTSETGLYVPDITAVTALNPQSAMIEVARSEGITTALLTPGGSRIAGQAGLVDFDGWTANEMVVDPRLGLVVSLPSRSPEPILDRRPPPDRDREFEEQRAREREEENAVREFRDLEQFFKDAQLYAKARGSTTGGASAIAPDPRFEAMIPYVRGEKPVFFNAASFKAILEALAFADQFKLRPIVLGGRDAWKLAGTLAERNVPVIYDAVFAQPGGIDGIPRISEAWDANYRAPSVMHAAGVKFCFANRDSQLAKNIVTEAGFAVAHGLSPDAAVRALTLGAAEILGIAQRVGSLEAGKAANIVVTTGHLCRTTTVVRHVFIGGKPIALESKHTRDAERFAERPKADLPPSPTNLRGPKSMTR